MKDDFGNRMKSYEKVFTSQKLDSQLPIVVRLDGHGFSKFTKGHFQKPFDDDMTFMMQKCTQYLMEYTNADYGYCQSDEITLLFLPKPDSVNYEFLFGGKVSKINSVFAGFCSSVFSRQLHSVVAKKDLPKNKLHPHFDCRCFNVPSETEMWNALLWRVQDANRNAISGIAQSMFSHNQLFKKSRNEQIEMIEEINSDRIKNESLWNLYGSVYKKCYVEQSLSDEIWNNIPDDKKPESRIIKRYAIKSVPGELFCISKNPKALIEL